MMANLGSTMITSLKKQFFCSIETSVVYVAEKDVYTYNTGRKPSQRIQAIPRKCCFILELFKVVISHRYFNSLHRPLWVWSTVELFPRLENKMGDRKKRKINSNYKIKPNLKLSNLKRMLNLFTDYPNIFEWQVFHHIDKNVNETVNFSLKSQSFNKN